MSFPRRPLCWTTRHSYHKKEMRSLTAISLPPLAVLLLGASAESVSKFSDNFSKGELDTNKWKVATYQSADSKPGLNSGTYVPENIDFSQGMSRIAVAQAPGLNGVISKGGAIHAHVVR